MAICAAAIRPCLELPSERVYPRQKYGHQQFRLIQMDNQPGFWKISLLVNYGQQVA